MSAAMASASSRSIRCEPLLHAPEAHVLLQGLRFIVEVPDTFRRSALRRHVDPELVVDLVHVYSIRCRMRVGEPHACAKALTRDRSFASALFTESSRSVLALEGVHSLSTD